MTFGVGVGVGVAVGVATGVGVGVATGVVTGVTTGVGATSTVVEGVEIVATERVGVYSGPPKILCITCLFACLTSSAASLA